MDSIFDWPGKSDHERNERPAVLHMLDVAACAEKLIEKHTSFSRFSASQRRAFVILVALHDVGKLSESFKALVRQNRGGNPLHWELSDFLLCGTLDEILCRLGNDKWVRDELYAAVAGHHGQPPRRVGGSRRQKSRCGSAIGEGVQAARKWVRTLFSVIS